MTPEQQAALRAPFPKSAIGKLPKGGTQLDYVGHAAVTDRLLAVDPAWSWEPFALAPDGGPLVRESGKEAKLWIRMTVCGVTRVAVGIAPVNAFELDKQLISDAIRNGAMRFGVALDLWSKEDLLPIEQYPDQPRHTPPPMQRPVDEADTGGYATREEWQQQVKLLRGDIQVAGRTSEFSDGSVFPFPWRKETIERIREALRHPRGTTREEPF